jgi:hypothetical protein
MGKGRQDQTGRYSACARMATQCLYGLFADKSASTENAARLGCGSQPGGAPLAGEALALTTDLLRLQCLLASKLAPTGPCAP